MRHGPRHESVIEQLGAAALPGELINILLKMNVFAGKLSKNGMRLYQRLSTQQITRAALQRRFESVFLKKPSINGSSDINAARSFTGKPFRMLGRLDRGTRAHSTAEGGGSGKGGTGSGGGRGGGGGGGGGAGGESAASGAASLWAAYLALLEKQPVATKAVTSAILNAAGDLIAQLLVEQRSSIDWKRLATFAFLGLVLVGPALHFWYLTLSRLVPAATTAGALTRLALDQLAFAPIFLATFFVALLTLEGQPGLIQAKLKQDLKPTVIKNWQIWVPFQFLNFRFVPQTLQVLVANFVALGWNTYLSFASHTAVKKT
eukprot:jgi/Botrbrau1/13764/Bobra.0056s0020.1